jgi:hypothetical protein
VKLKVCIASGATGAETLRCRLVGFDHSSVGRAADLRPKGRGFDSRDNCRVWYLHFPFAMRWLLHQVVSAYGLHTARIDCKHLLECDKQPVDF